MRVVSNTSPICNLAVIGRLDLLKHRYGSILLPNEVKRELSQLSHAGAQRFISGAIAVGWLQVSTEPLDLMPLANFSLDPGETAAIALALQLKADVVLIDERLGREVARGLNLKVTGVLGELIHAKLRGWIPSLRFELGRLKTEAHFFVDAKIENFILKEAGEI